ncbi:class II aldolase/adducin family protein [Methylotetracoccus oryzae]|uniref:class II aldolase/adducin family protein n=1 Tax=Methylotetracoccus oryzae TaxID=1919059 RepID=UPI001119C0C8|nr:class II aldolase/adducin family protein [Methylotetracoccus oryzae]
MSGCTPGADSAETEGVTKFVLDFLMAPPVEPGLIVTLNAWRTVLYRLGLTGRDRHRYGGLAYGNVSQRLSPATGAESASAFLISGTQTGGLPVLESRHYSCVASYDLSRNRISATGPLPPSSEALTHAAVYSADPRVNCVIHVHSPEIWQLRSDLKLTTVPPEVAYGTPEMAYAIAAAAKRESFPVVAMAGHRDGLISCGANVRDAAERMIETLAHALALGAAASPDQE